MRRQYNQSEKLKIVKEVKGRRSGRSIEDACEDQGINRSQYFRWRKAFELGGPAGLATKSRRPKRIVRKLSSKMQKLIIEEANSGQFKSPAEITRNLKSRGFKISNKTVGKILISAGMYDFKYDQKTGKRKGKRRYIIIKAQIAHCTFKSPATA